MEYVWIFIVWALIYCLSISLSKWCYSGTFDTSKCVRNLNKKLMQIDVSILLQYIWETKLSHIHPKSVKFILLIWVNIKIHIFMKQTLLFYQIHYYVDIALLFENKIFNKITNNLVVVNISYIYQYFIWTKANKPHNLQKLYPNHI